MIIFLSKPRMLSFWSWYSGGAVWQKSDPPASAKNTITNTYIPLESVDPGF